MYIIELYFKIREKIRHRGGFRGFFSKKTSKKPDFSAFRENEEAENTCEHIFSAIDSTNTVLACTKCGYIIHTNPEDLKKINIFKENYDNNFDNLNP